MNETKRMKKNIAGARIKQLRLNLPDNPSQVAFTKRLQLAGLNIDNSAFSRIESGSRLVSDIELKIIASELGTTYDTLLDD